MKFETKNARYEFRPSLTHYFGKTKTDEDSYDAFVFESGQNSYEKFTMNTFKKMPIQFEDIAQKAIESKKPIYLVDPKPIAFFENRNADLAAYLVIENFERLSPLCMVSLKAPLTLALALPSISMLGAGTAPKIDSYFNLSNFYTPSALRSAVSARKIEENIAPRIRKRKNDKPNIWVEFGAGHSDIIPYLKYKTARNSVIRLHKLWNYFPIDKEYLSLIKEFNFDGNPSNLGEVVSNHDYPDGHKETIYKIA